MVRQLLMHFTYVGLLALLIAAGLGVPFPEDVTLLTGGALAHQGIIRLWPTLILGYVGVVVGDLSIFRLGRKLGPKVYTHKRLGKLLTPTRRRWIERHFKKHGILTVVIGRHTPGLRTPTFLIAGSSGMRTLPFLISDALSALLTTPLVVLLGYKLAENLTHARHELHRFELWGALALVVIALVAMVLWRVLRRRHARPGRAPAKGSPQEV